MGEVERLRRIHDALSDEVVDAAKRLATDQITALIHAGFAIVPKEFVDPIVKAERRPHP